MGLRILTRQEKTGPFVIITVNDWQLDREGAIRIVET